MTLRHRISCGLLTLITATAMALPNAPSATAADCPAVDAIAVPGTTQTHPDANPTKPVGVLGGILEPLKKHTKVALTTTYIPYAATIIGGTDGGGYRASKNSGIDSVNAHLKNISRRCSRTVFLLTGYSQGADVAGDIASAIGRNQGAIPANRLLGVALVADPSQSPVGQPTIGLNRPGFGFAGVRKDGFGTLTARNGILSLCAPLDYFCNLPQSDVVMRFIGHLGSQLDAADPSGSAQKLATLFMAGLIAPATAAISQILQLVNDPQLIPNLISRGITFAKALTQQLFWLAGPQVATVATELLNAAHQTIGLIYNRQWAAIPATIATIATRATAVATTLNKMQDNTKTINVSGFGPVGANLASPGFNFANLATAVLNAITTATGGIGLHSTGVFGPTFAQFSAANVTAALKHFAEFTNGNFHNQYDTIALDKAGHSGTQIAQRYFVNQLNKLV
ncbi:cutinase family protein [Mycobacterium sp. DBP42]|uniref:cutinase family protein n=1 Tax=Mycobacteriaceae TaxID=1762 RepID=UPI00110CBD2F|nr:cutinase family protein [Mycobacterium sp. DBP42]TMS50705.1 cutinase family protein [Mycobacterium sp. DBP42]